MPWKTLLSCLASLPLSALALSLSGNYTPAFIECPSGETFVRDAFQSLSPEETAWLAKRLPNVVQALQSYLTNVGIEGFNVSEFVFALNNSPENAVPIIGLTWSGGGQRAESSDLGQLYSFDGRISAAVNARTGGLLQATTYVAGLSGGSTGLVPVAMSDFDNIEVIAQEGLLSGNNSRSAFSEIAGKGKQGFNLSVSDVFAIALGNATLRVPGNDSINPFSRLWSDITTFSNFSAGLSPLPILTYNEVIPPGLPGHNSFHGLLLPTNNARLNGTFYEATPFEVGSWQGRVSAFVKTQYLGTNFSHGAPLNNTCVQGFDTAAFMLGSADSAMNFWVSESLSNGTVGQFAKRSGSDLLKIPYPPHEDQLEQQRTEQSLLPDVQALPGFLELIGNLSAQDAVYGLWPNPFHGSKFADKHLQTQDFLYLTDGSEYGQANPIVPLIQKSRSADFIIVNDGCGSELSVGSSDQISIGAPLKCLNQSGWMNGTNFGNTADWAKFHDLPFPKIPSVNTILNRNYTLFPTFYGCFEKDVPLVLFAADAPYTEYSNISVLSTTDLTSEQRLRLWNNTLNIYTQPHSLRPNVTADFPTCIACGAIYRSLQRLNLSVPDVCNTCFKEYCWDGTEDNSQPGFLAPALLYDPQMLFAEWNASFSGNANATQPVNSTVK
ncbi:FabD/lysophospholipase-like protein [Irpex lacteus]|nr:FabD/lysophospholipase-like protein [Irpex lacteus]